MEMRKCMKGHYYDASVHASCPYCNQGENVGVTVAMVSPVAAGEEDSKTLPLGYQAAPAPAPVSRPLAPAPTVDEDEDDGRTIAIIHKDMGIDPVVGWLVAVNGKEKGRDYRIHTDNNFIGRSDRMDICLRGDETVSRENHAIVSYDDAEKDYYFSPGDGRSIVRVNGKAIFQTVTLNAYDKLTIGKTELIFIPLCGSNFEWGNTDAAK